MLRRFSAKRIAGFFLLDWLGSLALLYGTGALRNWLGKLPEAVAGLLRSLGISIGGLPAPGGSLPVGPLPAPAFILAAAIWPICFAALSVYDGRRNATLGAELRRVLAAVCVATLALAGALFLSYRETSRLTILLFFVLDLALLLGARLALWAYRLLRTTNGRRSIGHRGVLIVGAGSMGQRAAAQLAEVGWTDIVPVGYLDDDPAKQGQVLGGLAVLGTLDEVADVAQKHQVRDALIALPARAHERLVQISRTLQGLDLRVHVIPDLLALSFPNAALDGFGGIPVLDLGQPGAYAQRWVSRRAFDVTMACLLLVLLSPLYALVAVLIKLDSRGPVIYRQERIGQHGRPFVFLKFRSMRDASDSGAHRAHMERVIRENLDPQQAGGSGPSSLKLAHDPRITRVGRVIRKLSIDELPQLVNVLRGEMSLVGPRPGLPYELAMYQEWQKRRLEALPGLTGWWQVKGRNRVSFDEMVRMDLYYMDHSSFWLDVRILLLTPWAALSGKGAG